MKFTVGDLRTWRSAQMEQGQLWAEHLDVESLSMGLYRIPSGTNDKDSHTPHERDEVYIGLEGKGKLTIEDREIEVSKDSVVFVQAGVEHHFHDVTEDLLVLVLFVNHGTR